jgi:hypothetical protein
VALNASAMRSSSVSLTGCQSSSPMSFGLLVQGFADKRKSGGRRSSVPITVPDRAKYLQQNTSKAECSKNEQAGRGAQTRNSISNDGCIHKGSLLFLAPDGSACV